MMYGAMLEPAGFWRRSTANFIDGVIIGLFLQMPLQICISLMLGPQAAKANAFLGYIVTVMSVAYYVYFLSSHRQATPGKMYMRVYVISTETGGRVNQMQALWRWVAFTGPAAVWMIMPIFMGNIQDDMLPKDYQASIQHVLEVQEKKSKGQPVSASDQQLLDHFGEAMKENSGTIFSSKAFWAMTAIGIVSGLYGLMIACTVAFTPEKKGFHDSLCKTRVVRGRP